MRFRSGWMRTALAGVAVSAAAVATLPLWTATAEGERHSARGKQHHAFEHRGTFDVPTNLLPGEPTETITSAEIVDVTRDGRSLVYTDSPTERLGFVDIRRPGAPVGDGTIDLPGEPTSTATFRRWALVAVNTSEDPDGDGPLNELDAPSGELVVVHTRSRRVRTRIPLAGQPDSIAISPDRRYAAIVIENERDEDENDGLLPQPPPGLLQVLDLRTLHRPHPRLRDVSLSGLAEIAPEDPEPEYVDVNDRNQAVVSLQENNHLAIVDLRRARVRRHFSAGRVALDEVDATEEELGPQENGLITLGESITRRREPDAVAWVDDRTFTTANEGDYEDADGEEGGARGFTIFDKRGRVEYESGASLEHEIVRAGHYPEGRSANKGNEPEGVEVGRFGRRELLFVGSERANVVGVYDVRGRKPRFLQLLPTGIGPEGIKAIPRRDLLAVSAEEDLAGDGSGIRSIVTVYRLERGRPSYPQLESADEDSGLPIPWVAISGLAGDPQDADRAWAVSDSFLAQPYVYELDLSRRPARIVDRIPVGDVDVDDQAEGDFDLEGIAARPEGGFWLASEGRTDEGSSRPNLLVRADEAGNVIESVPLPPSLVAESTSSGFEGVAVTGSEAGGDEVVWAVIQREWEDDPPGSVKIGRYEVAAGEWTFARYPLDPVSSPAGGWVGLSEISLLPDGERAAIVERDNQIALDARVKRIYGVDLTDPDVEWRPHGEPLDVVEKSLLRDALPDLDRRSISVPDKLEGLAVTADRRVLLATDNDGVDENYGEALLFGLGPTWRAFGR